MKIEKTGLDGVLEIYPHIFKDFRGRYVETYNQQEYKANNVNIDFVQDDISISMQNVLRGIHGDDVTWKLVSCLEGSFYLVVVNCIQDSPDFGKWVSFDMSEDDYKQILIPPNHGNAHLVLSGRAIFHYKQSTYYDRSRQFTYKWNDERFNINWPVNNPILSERDA